MLPTKPRTHGESFGRAFQGRKRRPAHLMGGGKLQPLHRRTKALDFENT